MDEYSPKRHDIAQLKFLCETLYHDCLANLEESNHGWVNDPTSAINLQLNELIEHIATFALNYKIKYNEDNKLIEQIDEYLDDTFMLFSSYGINMQDLQKWRKSGNRLFRCFVNATKENPASTKRNQTQSALSTLRIRSSRSSCCQFFISTHVS